ncbi:MAG TPA: APC family permease [Pseudonocardia sp.]|jgi:amino acid transporter|uniref:APC family permease n=1 Tax=Pseudonocardia sp. TaxID=60912 RepID=UPI002F420206
MRVGLPTTDESQPSGKHRLARGALTTRGVVFLVVSAAAPLSILAGVGPLAISVGGVGAPVSYLAAGAVLAIFAVGFTAMAKHVRSAGAFYAYVARGLGSPMGLAAAVLALVCYNALQIGMYGLLAVQVQGTLLGLGYDVPWPVIAIVAIFLVWALGHRGVEVGAKVLAVLLTAETAILLLMALGVLAHGGADGLDAASFTPHAIFNPGVGAALTLGFAAFMGFESTALYRKEARAPERTIPRATFIAVGSMALVYGFIMWAVVQAFGSANAQQIASANTTDMFFIAVQKYVGVWASNAMHLLIITSIYAAQLAFHNAINRYVYALSEDRVLPAWMGTVHSRLHSPYRAGQVQSMLALLVVCVFALLGLDPYHNLLIWVNSPAVVGLIALQALTAISVVAYFVRTKPRGASRWVVPAAALASILLIGATLLMVKNINLITNAGPAINAVLVAVTPVSLIVGVLLAWRLRALRPDVYACVGRDTEGPKVPVQRLTTRATRMAPGPVFEGSTG